MAVSQFSSGSTAMTVGTEVVLTADPITTAGVYQFFADVSPLVATEICEFRLYEKINDTGDTQRAAEPIVAVAGMRLIYSPAVLLLVGFVWKATQLNGSNRTIQWSLRTL